MKNRYMNVLLAMGIGAALAVTASAQTTDPAPAQSHARKQASPSHQVHNLAKKLGLTSDQQNQLLPVFTERSQQIAAMRADTSINVQDRRAKMQELRQQTDAKIKAVLTDAQKQQYDQLQQERTQKGHRQKG